MEKGDAKDTMIKSSRPAFFDLSRVEDAAEFSKLLETGSIKLVNDEYISQCRELFAIGNPAVALSDSLESEFAKYLEDEKRKGSLDKQGKWVYYPWSFMAVHILNEPDFHRVRTARNRNLITESEQKKFYDCTVGIAGLSVGNSVALAIVLMGGSRRMKLADHDTLDLSNLNRIRAGITSLGISKVEMTARQIYELNPYAELEIYPDGLTEDNITQFFDGLRVVIDEVDNLSIKSKIREEARALRIPVLMAADNADTGLIDIERYDADSSLLPFHGRIIKNSSELKSLNKKEVGALIADFVGFENHSERMLDSLSQLVGTELISWPQLGGTALLNGSALAYAVRRIACDQPLITDRAILSLENLLIPTHQSTISQYNSSDKNEFDNVLSITKLSRDLEFILNAARQAPSADNTQPWRVVINGGDAFSLYHVPGRDMTPYDTGQRTSYMSHGAFLENASIAAEKLNKRLSLELEEPIQNNNWLVARVTITNAGAASKPKHAESDLFNSISQRATNRKPYRREKLSESIKKMMSETCEEYGWGSIRIIDYPALEVAQAAALSGQIMFQNADVYNGLFSHIRWDKKEADRTRDGMHIDTFELPAPGKLIFKLAQSKKRLDFLNRTINLAAGVPLGMSQLYEQSGAFVGIISKQWKFSDYILLGRVMERLWLKSTSAGISLQPVGAICFFKDAIDAATTSALTIQDIEIVNRAHSVLKNKFSLLENERLLFIFRAGVAEEPSAKTSRFPLSQIISNS